MAYQSKNPYNGEVGKIFDETTDDQLEAMIKTADACFRDQWRQTTFDQRKAILKRAAAMLRERSDLCLMIACSVGGIKIRDAVKDTAIRFVPMLWLPRTSMPMLVQ